MPVVTVSWLEGRTPEQREALVEAITKAMSNIGGAKPESVNIILNDVAPTHWSKDGKLFAQRLKADGDGRADSETTTPPSPTTTVNLAEFGDATRTVFDLEQPRREGMPVFPPHLPGYTYLLHRHHEDDYEETRPRTSASGVIICMEHTGTHIDAICHQADDLMLFGSVPVAQVQTGKGFTRGGAEEIPSIFAPGVLLDAAASKGVQTLEQGYAITAADLQACCEHQGITIQSGDVVLIRTGNARNYWDDHEAYLAGPGMAADASRWLAAHEVLAVGADNMAWDVIGAVDPDLGVMLPGHLILLARHGIHIIENLDLEQLAHAGRHSFLFVCASPKFVGATGSPVRPLAVVNGGDQRPQSR
jgi:4-oxalocrotonate tautomerase family enzyme